MTTLSNYLNPDLISCDLASAGKKDVLVELGKLLAKPAATPTGETITTALLDRESLATTGVGDGVAIPHAKLEGLDTNRIAVGISRNGVAFDSVDGQPVNIFFALVAPINSAGDHLRILAQISRLLKDVDVRKRLIRTESSEQLIDIIAAEGGEP